MKSVPNISILAKLVLAPHVSYSNFNQFVFMYNNLIGSLLFWLLFAAFIIKHFSDTVEYSINGFLEKNRDTISKELVAVLKDSDLPICRKLMTLGDKSQQNPNESLGGRVKINASKHLVRFSSSQSNINRKYQMG